VTNLVVVDNPQKWPLHIPGVPTVSARAYLSDPRYSEMRNLKVFNLCKSYRYQSTGYYVSLLAMARGHKPLPSILTIQDMKILTVARIVADDMDELIQRDLKSIRSATFTLSIYFGRNLARRYDELSSRLFRLFQAPLLRAEFVLEKGQRRLQSIGPIAGNDIPASHREFVAEAAIDFFSRNRMPSSRRSTTQYDLAVLVNPAEDTAPSNKAALRKFAMAGKRLGLDVQMIERADFGRIAEFDALFIRETTSVNHHTYRFARRAAAEGLVVIDDPESIAKCSNKVYLAELLGRHGVPTPRTFIVHRDNRDRIVAEVGLPCILKQPDSSFSQGVIKIDDASRLDGAVTRMLDKSDLIIAQEFAPSEYDWRIGILGREPLYACRYFMVDRHWQIAKTDDRGRQEGETEAIPLDLVPVPVVRAAVRAGRLIGDGLYGVDLKQFGRKVKVIEVNDNPSLDAGVEDVILKNELYDRIMRHFLEHIRAKKNVVNGATG
jgi:glutathione synthase/RimK-type ligase-like ATP-grasp enzyme